MKAARTRRGLWAPTEAAAHWRWWCRPRRLAVSSSSPASPGCRSSAGAGAQAHSGAFQVVAGAASGQ